MKFKSVSRAAYAIATATCLLVVTTIFAQQLAGPSDDDGTTAKYVCKMISRSHINHKEVDDAIAPKLFDAYLSTLDPLKVYFVAADIDEFGKTRTLLDDQLRDGDVKFAYTLFHRFS